VLLVYTISRLETYLSENFISLVLNDDTTLSRFYNSFQDFKHEKMPLCELWEKAKKLNDIAFERLQKIVWHNLKKIVPLYKDILNIEFPRDIGLIYKMIEKRHNIVHRCGKDKDGQETKTTKEELSKLIAEIERLVNFIDNEIKNNDEVRF
jgi:hypothetical protein